MEANLKSGERKWCEHRCEDLVVPDGRVEEIQEWLLKLRKQKENGDFHTEDWILKKEESEILAYPESMALSADILPEQVKTVIGAVRDEVPVYLGAIFEAIKNIAMSGSPQESRIRQALLGIESKPVKEAAGLIWAEVQAASSMFKHEDVIRESERFRDVLEKAISRFEDAFRNPDRYRPSENDVYGDGEVDKDLNVRVDDIMGTKFDLGKFHHGRKWWVDDLCRTAIEQVRYKLKEEGYKLKGRRIPCFWASYYWQNFSMKKREGADVE